MLYKFGFSDIWELELQEVIDRDWFLHEFRNRLLDYEQQNWRASEYVKIRIVQYV